jgi:hypothetical protein
MLMVRNLRCVGNDIIWEVDCDDAEKGAGGGDSDDGITGSVEYSLYISEVEETPVALETPLAVLCIVKPAAPRFRCACAVQANIRLDVDKLMEGKIEAIIGLEVLL